MSVACTLLVAGLQRFFASVVLRRGAQGVGVLGATVRIFAGRGCAEKRRLQGVRLGTANSRVTVRGLEELFFCPLAQGGRGLARKSRLGVQPQRRAQRHFAFFDFLPQFC
jgi:hypothetical protein